MSDFRLQCPHCSTWLRLRDASFVGRVIACPDCGGEVRILRDSSGAVTAQAVAASESQRRRSAEDAPTTADATPHRALPRGGRRDGGRFWTPARIAWGSSLLLAVLLLGWFVLQSPGPADPTEKSEVVEAPAVRRPEEPAVQPPGPPAAPEEATSPEPEAAARLRTIAGWIEAFRARNGLFPGENRRASQLNEPSRLGWLAELTADREAGAVQPLWDRPLDDPLNSRFVRRRMPDLLNPVFHAAAGRGYPATNFIGVAGVGGDAPMLPKGHPRAGIFGIERATRAEDVTDGLSNTLLVVGLNEDFPPWAAGGRQTVRGFSAEPYINGPDHFGTGQPDGMSVAMADGSVRFLSSETSPLVVRRMAAMADGLPLDPTVPGEPGATAEPAPLADANAMPPRQPPQNDVGALPAEEPNPLFDAPIAAQVARDPVEIPKPDYNVARALQQPVRRFTQSQPVKFRALIQQIEELAGVPIVLDAVAAGPAAAQLDREVTLSLDDTTVEAILSALAARVGLGYETGSEFGIRLTAPASP